MSGRQRGRRAAHDRRPEWLRAVKRSATITPTTKLVLVETGEHMRADGKVCVERWVIANALGMRYHQRVTERWAEACESGFLTLVHKGSHGRASTYQGLFPGRSSDRESRSLDNPENPVTRATPKRPGNAVAIPTGAARPPPQADPAHPTADRYVGSDEKPTTTDAVNVRRAAVREDDQEELA